MEKEFEYKVRKIENRLNAELAKERKMRS